MYIVIHSMDVGQLKNTEWQNYLSEISELRRIALIVSLDHIKGATVWNEQMLDKFQFCSIEVNTFADYDMEYDYQGALFSEKSDNE